MVREISAGGVVIRNRDGQWWMAAIEPPSTKLTPELATPEPPVSAPAAPEPAISKSRQRKPRAQPKPVLCLPKGLVDPGEKALEAALREVREETGIAAVAVTKLADVKYVYVRTWGDRERVFKVVSFFLLRYESGRIDDISDEMRIEVARAQWVRLEDAPKLLAYWGEKQMARKALEYLRSHPEV
jgi:8-oxo-dGTP pyrophosphatase MutT (NUDIX family)